MRVLWRASRFLLSINIFFCLSRLLHSILSFLRFFFQDKDRFKADQEEEYEDSLGNVVSKKTYEDLKRQGLL